MSVLQYNIGGVVDMQFDIKCLDNWEATAVQEYYRVYKEKKSMDLG